MKRMPIGIQTINELIEQNYVYVDKTQYIYKLMQGKYYFLSRPRRFGKSLLISTIKEVLSGNKDLFKDLWIYNEIDWEKHPVIHIDFSVITHSKGIENFESNIGYFLEICAKDYNIVLDARDNKEKFHELTKKLYDQYGSVVILIDEYDKPIIDHIDDAQKAFENKEILANFYETIKYMDKYLKFVFITGVSKFSKVSIFSKLNNLKDITLNKDYSAICGYTQKELEYYYKDHIDFLSKEIKMNQDKLLVKIKDWYNGYSWGGENTVYNPFGILNLFDTNEFKNYWFQTATPTFLIKLIEQSKIHIEDFEGYSGGDELFESYDIENCDPVSLLVQTGYLTIKEVRDRLYVFGYPNFEVKESFLVHLLAAYSKVLLSKIKPTYFSMLDYLKEKNLKKFQMSLVSLFASIPSKLHLDYESYYHSMIYMILALLGVKMKLEEYTDKGIIDGVLELDKIIYVIEFKLDSAEDAIKQIKDKKYYEKYLNEKKEIILLGVGGFRDKNIVVISETKNHLRL